MLCDMLRVQCQLRPLFSYCVGFEIDEVALATCSHNLREAEVDACVDLVQCDVLDFLVKPSRWTNSFDTVLINPPFGTKHNRGALQCT